MPPRRTYGKKSHNTFYTPSFSWSSPGKTPLLENSSAPDLAKDLQNLNINQEANGPGNTHEDRALRTKDSNARKIATTTGAYENELKGSLNSKRAKSPPLKAQEHAVAREFSGSTCKSGADSALIQHVQPLLNLCSEPAARSTPALFSAWSSNLDEHFEISKIAEASYGEVYRLSLKTDVPGFSKADESVMKLIALKPPMERDESLDQDQLEMTRRSVRRRDRVAARREDTGWMSSIEAVVSEVRLLRRMTTIPGFTNFREIRILRGRPGKPFVAAWKAYNKAQIRGQKSMYPDPSKKLSYSENQLWAVIEMQDAGTDLERVQLGRVWCVWDVFWGVAIAIAKGEENAKFEVCRFE
jgi:serine/threonine-protein kinase haspin